MIDKILETVFGPEALAVDLIFDVIGGVSQKSSSNKAAKKAQEIANFNAEIIERDFGLLQKQADLINANAVLRERRDRFNFNKLQGDVRVAYGYGNIDIAQGTPMDVMRQNAREFELDMLINQRNDSVALEQIADAQENVMLQADLARMGGVAQASALRAQGSQALINAVGNSVTTAYERGLIGGSTPAPSVGSTPGSTLTT